MKDEIKDSLKQLVIQRYQKEQDVLMVAELAKLGIQAYIPDDHLRMDWYIVKNEKIWGNGETLRHALLDWIKESLEADKAGDEQFDRMYQLLHEDEKQMLFPPMA